MCGSLQAKTACQIIPKFSNETKRQESEKLETEVKVHIIAIVLAICMHWSGTCGLSKTPCLLFIVFNRDTHYISVKQQ